MLQLKVMNMERGDLVEQYFRLGFSQKEILSFLSLRHNIKISHRSLKRMLRRRGLYRRKYFTNLEVIVSFLQREVQRSSQLHGYRWMHLRCLQHGFTVTQDVIRLALNAVDPHGVDIRRRRRLRRRAYFNHGPNFLWHLDSYDKLKRYGICINGCIDGFSRYIIWLKAGLTNNNNPKVIASYYYEAITLLKGYPRTIRADCGTENGYVENMQRFLKEMTDSNSPAFLYGRSTANQRIESWWSQLRNHNAQFWINLFEKLKADGYYDGLYLDKSVLQFCFMDLIQVISNDQYQCFVYTVFQNFALLIQKILIWLHPAKLYCYKEKTTFY